VTESKSSRVRKILLESLKNNKYQIGDRIESDNALSKRLEISKSPVREAISSLVSDGYLKRIQGKGTFVISTAQQISYKRSSKIIHLISQVPLQIDASSQLTKFRAKTMTGLLSAFSEQGWGLCFTPHCRVNKLHDLFNSQDFQNKPKDGIIFAGINLTPEDEKNLKDLSIPSVSVGRQIHAPSIPYVDVDHEHATYKATKYLLKNGHHEIGLIHKKTHPSAYQERVSGYKRALKEYGIAPSESLILDSDTMTPPNGKGAVIKLLKEKIKYTSLIIFDEVNTFEAVKQLKEKGYDIPNDISIVSYSSYTKDFSSFFNIEFTRIEESHHDLACRAGKMLVDILKKKEDIQKNIVMHADFITGNSVSKRSILE